jgi:hypothetical protein
MPLLTRLKDPVLYKWHSSERLRYWAMLITCPFFCCCYFAQCHLGDCTGANKRREREKRNGTMSAVKHRRRVRHVKSRKRSVSVDAGRSWRRKRETKEQGQSPFFAMLPAEVRLRVYEMVLCAAFGESEIQANEVKRDQWNVRVEYGNGYNMAFLRTCRRIYVPTSFSNFRFLHHD